MCRVLVLNMLGICHECVVCASAEIVAWTSTVRALTRFWMMIDMMSVVLVWVSKTRLPFAIVAVSVGVLGGVLVVSMVMMVVVVVVLMLLLFVVGYGLPLLLA